MNLQDKLKRCRVCKAAMEVKEREILEQIRAEEEKKSFPIAEIATNHVDYGTDNRLIIRLTPMMVRLVRRGAIQISVDGSGYVANSWTEFVDGLEYVNKKPLFGDIKE